MADAKPGAVSYVTDPVSDAELEADLYRYRNNKAGSIYRLLAELKARRQAEVHCNICGGSVDLTGATTPTAKVGPGGRS